MTQRLNKYIATNLGVSRREADNLISAGKILVNKKPAEIGARVSDEDEVIVDGKKISSVSLIYVALNKPAGYVCSRKRQGETPTMYELLPEKYQSLKSVGRLDKDSSGLILLTNDGDFAFKMTHPSFVKTKIYEAHIDRALEPLHQQMISDFGIQLPDGRSQLGLEKLDETRTFWRIAMSEGRNRQIRRTFEALGYKVVELHRTNFGRYGIDGLESGNFTEVPKAD
ncbi:MAG: pseudouridine synthase [Candidatus Saccharibacteria bacterium]|nr:pseudouridine synthase [Candidatus Saccharibacteria bacterium]